MKLMIFDMDGLMFDSERVMLRAFLETCQAKGLKTSRAQGLKLIGKDARTIHGLYREYFGEDFDAPAMYRSVGQRIQHIVDTEGIPMKKGLLQLMDALEEAGIPKVIASGSSRKSIQEMVASAGLQERFDGIISSDEVKAGKPAPDVFQACLDLMDVAAEDALVLEDSPAGIQAAITAGIPVIAVPDLIEIPEELGKQCLAIKDSLDLIEI